MKSNKKGQIDLLSQIMLGLVVAGMIAVVGLSTMSSAGADFVAGSLEANATTAASTGISNITTRFALIGTIGGLVVVLGLVLFLRNRATR